MFPVLIKWESLFIQFIVARVRIGLQAAPELLQERLGSVPAAVGRVFVGRVAHARHPPHTSRLSQCVCISHLFYDQWGSCNHSREVR